MTTKKSSVIILMSLVLLLGASPIVLAEGSDELRYIDTRLHPVDNSSYHEKSANSPIIDGMSIMGALPATQEEIDYWSNITRSETITIDNILDIMNNSNNRSAYWVSLINNSNSFYYYGQETIHSCGPANARMVIQYMNQSPPPSESEIRHLIGGEYSGIALHNLTRFINNHQRYPYIVSYNRNYFDFIMNTYVTIAYNNAPPIVAVNEKMINGWPFDLGSHYITLYAALSDLSSVALCDSFAGNFGDDAYRWYDMSYWDVFNAYNTVFPIAGYMH